MRKIEPSPMSPAVLPHVVVNGAGFGGPAAAKALKSAPVEITLVDRRNFHLFQPLLYQVATAALSLGDIAWPVRSVFAGQKSIRAVMMEVNAIDAASRTVSDGVTTLTYDYLVVPTGATHAYFSHPDWARFAPGLKTIDDARALRERLLFACELAERRDDDEIRRSCVTTVIIDGGATGVEMAGAVAELSRRTLKGEFSKIDPGKMRIVLVEAASLQWLRRSAFRGG
jgi:NADH:ubiquinone reductase (H+-translocating)